jgi:aminopeptidase YwaD
MALHLKTLLLLLLLIPLRAKGRQSDSAAVKQFLHRRADILAGRAMHGRGYVKDGRMLASAYLQGQFQELGLKPAPGMMSYVQEYSFPVNTFPGKMKLKVNGKKLKPGADYIIDASAPSFSAKRLPVKTIDLGGVTELDGLKQAIARLDGHNAWLLTHMDSMCKTLHTHEEAIVPMLPEGCFIIPERSKLTWTVEESQVPATVFYVKEDALPADVTKVSVAETAALMPASENQNLIAIAPGTVADTFIAFSAHYDHLGMMGKKAVFPGASDNASGISMLLYLASWFIAHPQRYSVLFIAFSGEEPGLLGSQYYTAHPVVPLSSIKFLTNIDIMGDATDGITVVNATEFPDQYSLLQQINSNGQYLPVIKSRGKAHNSDHWYFTEAGVPSFFIYSNGGKGFYHDIYDKPGELTLNHVAGVAQLLIDFVKKLN